MEDTEEIKQASSVYRVILASKVLKVHEGM